MVLMIFFLFFIFALQHWRDEPKPCHQRCDKSSFHLYLSFCKKLPQHLIVTTALRKTLSSRFSIPVTDFIICSFRCSVRHIRATRTGWRSRWGQWPCSSPRGRMERDTLRWGIERGDATTHTWKAYCSSPQGSRLYECVLFEGRKGCV